MKKLFTKYLFFVFLLPVLVIVIVYLFGTRVEVETYGMNRRISYWGIDINGILSNPIYTIWTFYLSYAIYLLGYFIVFLLQRHTNLHYSIMNLIVFTINFFLISKTPENRILIPLTLTGFIIFIFNIFKTTKI